MSWVGAVIETTMTFVSGQALGPELAPFVLRHILQNQLDVGSSSLQLGQRHFAHFAGPDIPPLVSRFPTSGAKWWYPGGYRGRVSIPSGV